MRMRTPYTFFLVTVLALLVSVDAASVATNKLQNYGTDTAVGKFRNERFLRKENVVNTIATDGEERAGITKVLKSWLEDKALAAKLHLYAMRVNLDKPVQKLMARGIDPDRVFKALKLHKSGNANVGMYDSGELLLWGKLTAEWKKTYPNWVSKI
ncbi:hypothetical protein DVH05_024512 [Phytophthora capsici]|nr:hypothetical protein DVH05_024512 [Phytophthora capsici]